MRQLNHYVQQKSKIPASVSGGRTGKDIAHGIRELYLGSRDVTVPSNARVSLLEEAVPAPPPPPPQASAFDMANIL